MENKPLYIQTKEYYSQFKKQETIDVCNTINE